MFENHFLQGLIGVRIQNNEKGILITELIQNGGAIIAGLKVNDIIFKVNNIEVKNNNEFIEIISHENGGDIVDLQIQRDSETKNIKVKVGTTNTRIEEKLYHKESNFDLLLSLRKNISAYLKAMEKEGLDDKYREVYNINEKLKQYPKDKATWIKEKEGIEAKKIALDTYYRELAEKIEKWNYSDEIKLGMDFNKNLLDGSFKKSQSTPIMYVTRKLISRQLLGLSVSQGGKIEHYTYYVNDNYKNVISEFKTFFGENLLLGRYEGNKYNSYYITSPYTKQTIEISVTLPESENYVVIYKYKS